MDEHQKNTLEEYKSLNKGILDLKTKIQEISKQKEHWFEKKESLKKNINDLVKHIRQLKDQMHTKSTTIRELKDQRKKYNSEVKDLIKKIKKLHKEKEKAFEQYNIRIEPSKLLEKINILEKKVEIEISFDKEKKLMEEIKKLKKSYEESTEAFKLLEQTKALDKEIKASRKKANDFHQQIQTITRDNNYAKFFQLTQDLDTLKKTQEEAFQTFIKHKNEYLQAQQELRPKLETLTIIKQSLDKDKELSRACHALKQKELIKNKAQRVEEKIKTKKKLTTEDLLIYQGTDE
ncbi:MAG TPA: hypothetical protein VFE88_02955 [Candidatus Nanoarchaeia archaeon]|nr:hypothetical protein [Candidatus Nanoarchaeia archaeon]